jgi:hypothetical protein
MLPLHQCFKHGNDDKILELLLDVFPEALDVVDDKGRLPLGCTPADGSENERRSNILILYSKFQVEKAMNEKNIDNTDANAVAAVTSLENATIRNDSVNRQPLGIASPGVAQNEEETILGAAPRYTTNTDYNQVAFNAIKNIPTQKKQSIVSSSTTKKEIAQEAYTDSDRYAMLNSGDSENMCLNGRRIGMGLRTIPEDETLSPKKNELKLELMALGDKKKRKGLKKLFGKKTMMEI